MTTHPSLRSGLAFAAIVVAALPTSLHAQTDASQSAIVAKARETAKAVAAAAPSPAATVAPASPAASASPVASAAASPAPVVTGSPAPAASGVAGATVKPAANVTTVAGTTVPAGVPVIIVQAAPAAAPLAPNAAGVVDSTANNWLGGLLGIAILGGVGYFGIRAAKNRGITVEDGLKRMGIETQPAMPAGPNFAAMKPVPTPLPPLPSLAEMPLAGPASSAGLAMAGTATVQRTVSLVGVAGPVSGERFDLGQVSLPFSIGRDDVNSLALTGDTAISRRHAQIVRSGSEWVVGDAGSSNGTFVNGAKVTGQHPLRSGDEIQIGGSRFRFEG